MSEEEGEGRGKGRATNLGAPPGRQLAPDRKACLLLLPRVRNSTARAPSTEPLSRQPSLPLAAATLRRRRNLELPALHLRRTCNPAGLRSHGPSVLDERSSHRARLLQPLRAASRAGVALEIAPASAGLRAHEQPKANAEYRTRPKSLCRLVDVKLSSCTVPLFRRLAIAPRDYRTRTYRSSGDARRHPRLLIRAHRRSFSLSTFALTPSVLGARGQRYISARSVGTQGNLQPELQHKEARARESESESGSATTLRPRGSSRLSHAAHVSCA